MFYDDTEIYKSFCEINRISQESYERKLKMGLVIPIDNVKNKTQEVVIKPEALDVSALEEDNENVSLWRPMEWNQYKGQDNLKNILHGYINGSKKMNRLFPHILIDGKAGTGKTTIIKLIAHQLGVPFVECVTNSIESPQQFVDQLAEVKGGFLFLDELQEINRKVGNFILPLLEDFKINGKKVKPFTFAGATTEKGELIRKFKPLIDRMKIQKTLEPYTLKDLTDITKQYKDRTFPNIKINDNIYEQVGKNCRGTPRIAIRYIESKIFMNCDIKDVFKSYNIVKEGITQDDIKVLKLLNEKSSGVGLKAISAFLGTSDQNYLYQIEGYLLEKGLITITHRRQITQKGIDFLKDLKDENKK